jgi:hypothetical protein
MKANITALSGDNRNNWTAKQTYLALETYLTLLQN